MILIAGSPAPVDTEAWPPLAREIYAIKRNSPIVYHYESVHHLRFEMILRSEIVLAARALNASRVQFAVFSEARCNERFWHLTPQGGFRLRAGVNPSAAIRDIYWNGPLYAFECATAIPIVYYKAVLEAIGEVQFNRLFQNILLYSWNYDSDLGLIQENVSARRAVPGDVLYFDNPDVSPTNPEWQGVNVVVLDEDVYYGHGVGITSGRDIISGLNRRRRPGSMTSAFLMDLIVYPDFLYLSRFAPGAREEANNQTKALNPLQEESETTQSGAGTLPSDSGTALSAFNSSQSESALPQTAADQPYGGQIRGAPRIRVRVGRRRYVW